MMRGEIIVELDGWRKVYESRSLVIGFAKILSIVMGAPADTALGTSGPITSATVTDVNSVTKTIYGEWYADYIYNGGGTPLAFNASAGDDSYGIVVGTGTTVVTSEDFKLASKIRHGTSTGQLIYGEQSLAYSYGDTVSYVEISRVFTNNSGGIVTVRETGLIGRNYWKDENAVRNDVLFLVARDVLSPPVSVPNLHLLTVRYRLTLEV